MSDAKKKILVVDDDPDFVEVTKIVLESNDYEVFTAHDGATGLAKAKEARPDLMILDVMMATDSEGFDVARKIPETPELRSMAVVLVTGIREAKHLKYKFAPDDTWLPVNQVLEKPVAPERLLAEIRKALAARK